MTSSNSERRALAARFVALGDPTVVPDTSARLRARAFECARGRDRTAAPDALE